MKKIVPWLVKWSWRAFLAVLTLLLMVVLAGRLLFSSLPEIQSELTKIANTKLNANLQVQSMEARWNGGEPYFSLRGLELRGKNADVVGFRIDRLDVELNLRGSLLNWTPVFASLEVRGGYLDLVKGDGASWSMSGIDQIAASSPRRSHSANLHDSLLNWLSLQHMVDIENVRLNLRHPGEALQTFTAQYITLLTDGAQKDLRLRVSSGDGSLEINGNGLVNFTARKRGFFRWQGDVVAKRFVVDEFCILWRGCSDNIHKAVMDIDTHWRFNDGSWQVHGRVATPEWVYQNPQGNTGQLAVSVDLFMQGVQKSLTDTHWQIWLNHLNVDHHPGNGEPYQWQNNWYLTGGRDDEYTVTVASESIDLDLLKRLLLDTVPLSSKATRVINTLNPQGHLHNLVARFYPARKPFDFDLAAQLDNVSVDAWRGAPSSGHVSGRLRMGATAGYLDLDAEHFQLGLPKLFRQTWAYNTATGRIYWDIVDDVYVLKSDDLALTAPEGKLRGKMRLDIPLSAQAGDSLDMALTVGMTDGNAQYTGKYLPALLPMSSGLVNWLDTAIKSGDISSGGFLFNGPLVSALGKVDPLDSRWGLYFGLNSADLEYSPQWPAVNDLKGDVFVNDDLLEVDGREAKSAGAHLENIVATLPFNKQLQLNINSRVQADGEALEHFLTQTPLNEVMKGAAESWEMAGRFEADLGLALSLNNLDASTVTVKSWVDDFLFRLKDQGIQADHLKGEVAFSSARGLESRSLKGFAFGEPADFSIRPRMADGKLTGTEIDWRSRMSVTALQLWLKQGWLSLLEGVSDYHSKLLLDYQNSVIELTVDSQLSGIEIELPAPLGKPADEPTAFRLTLNEHDEYSALGVSLGKLGQMTMALDKGFVPQGALINLGQIPDQSAVAQLNDSNHVVVTGSLPRLDLLPWKQRFSGQPGKPGEQQLASRVSVEDVHIGALTYGEQQFDDVTVSLQQSVVEQNHPGMSIHFDSNTLKGSAWIPEQRNTVPWKLVVDSLQLPALEEKKESGSPVSESDKLADPLADVDPTMLPEMDVTIHHVQIGDNEPVSIDFELRHEPNGVEVDNLTGSLAGMMLLGQADWVSVDKEQRTWLQGQLKGPDIKLVQNMLGLSGWLEAKRSEILSNVNWHGSPAGMDIASMKGRIDLSFKQGRLSKLDNGSSGALKLFGILNTEALARRLKLDFSDLYSSGISFDRLTAGLEFHRGLVTFDKPMVLEGPSSNLKLDGTIDTNKRTMDMSLVVTLPLTSNLPILSVLMGTAPQVAGIIYIADKLVGKQVGQLASIRYRITGSFDKPEVTLDRLFSNKTKKVKKINADNQ